MALHDLKDVAQVLEVTRRCRADAPEGTMAQTLDQHILCMVEQLIILVDCDDRIRNHRRDNPPPAEAAPPRADRRHLRVDIDHDIDATPFSDRPQGGALRDNPHVHALEDDSTDAPPPPPRYEIARHARDDHHDPVDDHDDAVDDPKPTQSPPNPAPRSHHRPPDNGRHA